jgi:hypothetical protein
MKEDGMAKDADFDGEAPATVLRNAEIADLCVANISELFSI